MPHLSNSLPMLPSSLVALTEAPPATSVDLLAQASRVQLAHHVAQMYEHHNDVLLTESRHAVHQMRVATRRMRAVLGATQEVFKRKAIEPLNKELRRVARALGVVRDGDVLLEHLDSFAATLSPDDASDFTPFIKAAQIERDNGQAVLRRLLADKAYDRLLDDLTDFLETPLMKVIAPDDGLPILVRHRAGSAIWSRYEAVRRYETVLPSATTEQLHQLRIESKHLRYTLELFEAPLGDQGSKFTKVVKEAQEQLGMIHDADVAVERAQRYLRKHGEIGAVLSYIAARGDERALAVSKLPELWTKLTGDEQRQGVARAIAGL